MDGREPVDPRMDGGAVEFKILEQESRERCRLLAHGRGAAKNHDLWRPKTGKAHRETENGYRLDWYLGSRSRSCRSLPGLSRAISAVLRTQEVAISGGRVQLSAKLHLGYGRGQANTYSVRMRRSWKTDADTQHYSILQVNTEYELSPRAAATKSKERGTRTRIWLFSVFSQW